MIDGDMSQMKMAAVSAHEVFMAYIEAGFSRAEALQIVIQTISFARSSRLCSRCQTEI